MLTATIINTAAPNQIDRVRDTMSLANILATPSNGTPDPTTNAAASPTPSASTNMKEEPESLVPTIHSSHSVSAPPAGTPDSTSEFTQKAQAPPIPSAATNMKGEPTSPVSTMSSVNILPAPPNGTPQSTYEYTSETTQNALASPIPSAATTMKEEPTSPGTTTPEALEVEEGTDGTEGTPGVEMEDVPDHLREFICKNDDQNRCRTGQVTKDLSRKVISDHFGRNKACTRDITEWPLLCRKHYQRATYNKKMWQIRKLDLIYRQFDVIEAEFPGTTYDIQFKRSEEARLNEYSRKVASGMPEDRAKQAVLPVAGKHFEAPIDILRELYLETGKGKTITEVKTITEIILKMLQDDSTEQVPSIEFLPVLPGKIASPKRAVKKPAFPKKTRRTKAPAAKGASKRKSKKASSTKATSGRVSSKGSVQKPTQQ